MSWDRDKEKKAGKAYHLGFSVFGVIFAVFWCIVAASMGAGIMLIFGIPMVGFMVFRLVMIAKHAEEASQQQFRQETEPWEQQIPTQQENADGSGYCPYCGSTVSEHFSYCPACGRKLS